MFNPCAMEPPFAKSLSTEDLHIAHCANMFVWLINNSTIKNEMVLLFFIEVNKNTKIRSDKKN